MPRKGHVPKREVAADPVYGSELVSRLINKVMLDGKKSLAESVAYKAFQMVEEKTGKPAMDVFETAMKNIMPLLEVKPRRVGGSTYQVPIEVRSERRTTLAVRWLVEYARNRNERTMVERLANEVLDAANGTGGAVKRRDDVHRMAEANKPFAHYRW